MEAVVARFFKNVVRVLDVRREEGHLAVVAKDRVGFPELGIDSDAFIKNKAFTLIMVPSNELEIF